MGFNTVGFNSDVSGSGSRVPGRGLKNGDTGLGEEFR